LAQKERSEHHDKMPKLVETKKRNSEQTRRKGKKRGLRKKPLGKKSLNQVLANFELDEKIE